MRNGDKNAAWSILMMLLAVTRAAAGLLRRLWDQDKSSCSSQPPWRQKHTQLTSLREPATKSVSIQQQNQGSHTSIILIFPALASVDNPRFAQQQTEAESDFSYSFAGGLGAQNINQSVQPEEKNASCYSWPMTGIQQEPPLPFKQRQLF